MRKGSWLRAMLVLLVAIGLGSCGGGGGGGSPGFSVSFDTNRLVFDLDEGDFPDGKAVVATAQGTPPASGIFVGALVNGDGIQQPISISIDETTGKAYAYISPMYGLEAGSYSGSIQLLACADELCKQHFPGSPHTVNYSITVHPRLKVAPSMASFAVLEKQAVTPQVLALTLPDDSSPASIGVTYGSAAAGWLQVQSGAGSLVLSPNAAALAPGNYYAEVVVTASRGLQTVHVPVTLTVTHDPLQHLRVDRTSVSVAAPEGQLLPAETVVVSLPPGSTSVAAALGYGAGASGWLQLQQNGSTITLTPSTVGLAPGNYSATLGLTDPVSGESLAVPVTLAVSYDALQHLRVDQSSLAFAGVETQALAAKTLQFGLPPAATGLATSVGYGAGASGWLQVQKSGNDLQLTASTAGLAPGNYSANLLLQASGTSESLVVPVSLAVSKGLVALAGETVTVDMDALGSGQFAVQSVPGVTTSTWSATSNQPWLVLDAATGAIGDNVQWHLDPVLFTALANNADYTATVTVSGSGLSAVTRQFTIRKRFKEIAQIDTLALRAGESGDVLLYGEGFASFAAFADRLRLGSGLVPTSVTVMSDRLVRITLPEVPAGNYTISLVSAFGIPTREHTLRVLEPQDYTYQTVPTSGTKGSFVWDPVSRSAFAIDLTVSRIHRFGWDGAGFVNTVVSTPQPHSLAMDRSYQSLVLATWAGELQRRDPVTLELQSALALGDGLPPSTAAGTLPLPISGDNRAWLPKGAKNPIDQTFFPWNALQRVNVATGAQEVFTATGEWDFYRGPWGIVSPNGRRVVMTQTSSISPAPRPFRSDLIDNALAILTNPSTPAFFYQASSDRRGNVWLLGNHQVFDFDMNLQGVIWMPSGWWATGSALSPDGTRAYMIAYHNNAIDPYQQWQYDLRPRIYVYDTGPLAPTESSFPLLGYIELSDYPGCRQDAWSGCSFRPLMTIAEDGHTLFLVGDRALVVQPIPMEYRSAAAAPAAPLATVAGPALRGRKWPAEMRYWRLR